MRRFQDPGLFTDPLTSALVRAGYVPLGLQTLYRIASYAVDPVTLGPWLAVVLAPLSAWLVFLIVREHTDWWPAAWMGAALFLLPVNSLRFSGGHARAFGQPVVLLTVYLLLRRRYWTAAAVPAVGSLFYPPGAVSALAITAASCLTLRGRRPSLERARTLPALACVAVSGLRPAAAEADRPRAGSDHEVPGARPARLRTARADALLQQQPPFDPEGHLLGAGYRAIACDPALHPGRVAAAAPTEHPAPAARAAVDAGHLGAALCPGLRGAVPAVPSQPLHLPAAALLMRRHRRRLAADLRVARPPGCGPPWPGC